MKKIKMNVRKAKLYDSDTGKLLTARSLHISREQYIGAVRESRDCEQYEGHIRVHGRLVYAQ